MLTSLIAHPKGLIFADLKQLCGLTDGNLSRHLQILQEANLVEIVKTFEHNRPQTTCRHHFRRVRRRYADYLCCARTGRSRARPLTKAERGETTFCPANLKPGLNYFFIYRGSFAMTN